MKQKSKQIRSPAPRGFINEKRKRERFSGCRKTPSWPPLPANSATLVCGGKCCGTRVRGSVPQPQSSSLALPCQILVSVDGCQSLAAFGSCIHWMRAPSRRPITPAGTVGKRVPGGHNRHRRLATRRRDTKRAGTTAVAPATIEWQQCLLHLHFFDTLPARSKTGRFFENKLLILPFSSLF